MGKFSRTVGTTDQGVGTLHRNRIEFNLKSIFSRPTDVREDLGSNWTCVTLGPS